MKRLAVVALVALMSIAVIGAGRGVDAKGLLGGAVSWVGDRTGIKPISKGGKEFDNASRDIKNEAPVLGKVEEAVSRPVRETGKWIKENPEKALAIAAVVAVGWAACVDGCTVVGSLILEGSTVGGGAGTVIAIPLIAVETGKKKETQDSSARKGEAGRARESGAQRQDGEVYKPKLEKEYSHKYSKSEHPNGKPPVITYRRLDERLGEIFNEFAPPTYPTTVRVPEQGDSAGGVFTSPRKTGDEDAITVYGTNDARRIHAATDFLTAPGQPVMATLTGRVERIGQTETGFPLIEIQSKDGTISRVLYVHPGVGIKKGTEVKAGSTILGKAANLSQSSAYQGVPNHVHVDYTDGKGRRFDPWSNQVTVPNAPVMGKK